MADLKKVRVQLLDVETGEVLENVDVFTAAGAVTVLKDGAEIDLQTYLEALVLQKGDNGVTYDWLSGAVAPASASGKVGDWYINTATCDIYKKTAASTWTLQCNIKGATGAAGDTGAAGTSAYVHIRWGTSATPATLLTTPSDYIGIASTSSSTAPTTYSGYAWHKYKGETGETGATGNTGATGAQGAPGAAGTSSYTHIRYGATANPATLSTSPNDYMGIAVTTSSTAPATAASYTWYKIKGEPGDNVKVGATYASGKDVKLFFKVVE